MKSVPHKSNSIFKFLATSSKFKFPKKIEKMGENLEVTLEKRVENEQLVVESPVKNKDMIEKENCDKRKFSSTRKTKNIKSESSSSMAVSALDSLDSYYDSFLSTTRSPKTSEIESNSEEEKDNPSKKHCTEKEVIKDEEFQQKCTTLEESIVQVNDSEDEILCTPQNNYSSYFDNRRKEISETTTSNQEISEKVETPVEENDEIIPSSQPPEESRKYHKLKITSFFKKLDS